MQQLPCFDISCFADWQLLSKGGFGVVFKARQHVCTNKHRDGDSGATAAATTAGAARTAQATATAPSVASTRPVAVKALLPLIPGCDAKQHARSHKRFLEEVALQSSFTHRRIVRVLGTCRMPLQLMRQLLAAADAITPEASQASWSRTPSPLPPPYCMNSRSQTPQGPKSKSRNHTPEPGVRGSASPHSTAHTQSCQRANGDNGTCLATVYEYMSAGTLLEAIKQQQQEQKQQQRGVLHLQQQQPHQQQQYQANVLRWLTEVAEALAFLHGSSPQLIHRDVKPDNLLLSAVDGQLEAKLTDFGLVAVTHQQQGTKLHLTQQQQQQQRSAACSPINGRHSTEPMAVMVSRSSGSGTGLRLTGRCGSLLYMAPEVYRCEPYDHKCDVFSFALVAYEALTAQLLTDFMAQETMDECVSHAMRMAYEGWRPPVPAGSRQLPVWQLLVRCWSADPGQRPDMDEVAAVLRSVQASAAGAAASNRTCYLM